MNGMRSFPMPALGGVCLLSLVCACSGDASEPLDGSVDNAKVACELDWQVDSVVPCIAAPTLSEPPLIYSSHVNAEGLPSCDPYVGFPQPVPEDAWSSQRLIAETAGTAELCISIKQGKADAPTASDCALFTHCEQVSYPEAGTSLDLPDLPGWSAQDEACARAYYDNGGYVELKVTSSELGCGEGGEQVSRVQMCPNDCKKGDTRDKCDPCKFQVTNVTGSF